MVEQLLFISERDRRYIQLNVVFLTTCVNNSDEDSWGDLKRLLKYLKVKRHMKLTLTLDSMYMVIFWVDAYFNNHKYCKRHNGYMMSLRKLGVVIS